MPDIAWLRHPTERSRLVLAVAASVALAGIAAVLIAKRLETDQVVLTMVAGPLAAVLGWLGLQLHRANLLGNAMRVTPESLPELHAVLEEVRAQLGYDRRVDVYVTDRVDGLMTLTSLFGTRVILMEGDLVATLLEGEKRRELTFLVARFIGSLRSRRDRVAPLRLLVTLARPIGLVNVFLWPYDRAVVHTGDQIGLAVSGDLDASLNALDRLLVGGTLGPRVRDGGVFDQATHVRRRRLPRLAQLFNRQPHLANRYVNLMAFAERHAPEQRAATMAAMDEAGAIRLGDLAARTPHRSWHPRRRRVLVPAAGALAAAAVIAGAAVALPGGMAEATADPETALLAHVPPSFAGTCVPAEDADLPSIVCTAAAPTSVDFQQHGDARSLRKAFDGLVRGVEDGGCGNAYAAGRLKCWKLDDGTALAWTDERAGVLALAIGRGMEPAEILRWWLSV